MKKTERYIYIVLIVILVGIIVGGTTYMLMKDNNKTDIKETDSQNNNEKDQEDNNDQEKPITLSNSELEKYLDYVPVYNLKSVNINTIDKDLLLYNALGEETLRDYNFDNNKEIMMNDPVSGNTPTKNYYSIGLVNSILKKRYNYELTDFKNETDGFNVTYKDGSTMWFYYDNGNFILCGGGSDGTYGIINIIDSYEANKSELTIYEYHAIYEGFDKITLKDEYNSYEQDITNIEFKENNDKLKEVIKNNKNKFTKYKHTFKKSNTGYYWYSTEVV